MLQIDTTAVSLQNFYPENLIITSIDQEETSITIHMKSKTSECKCPSCDTTSNKFYATHHKKVQDFPILGKRVMLDIILYEFQCSNVDCGSVSFTEPYSDFLNDYLIIMVRRSRQSGVAWFFRNYPYRLAFTYISFAAKSALLHLPYIVRFTIFNLLFVPSTKPFESSQTTEFSTASRSFSNPFANRDISFK